MRNWEWGALIPTTSWKDGLARRRTYRIEDCGIFGNRGGLGTRAKASHSPPHPDAGWTPKKRIVFGIVEGQIRTKICRKKIQKTTKNKQSRKFPARTIICDREKQIFFHMGKIKSENGEISLVNTYIISFFSCAGARNGETVVPWKRLRR